MRFGRAGTYKGTFIYTVVIEQPGTLIATQARTDWRQDAWTHARDAARMVAKLSGLDHLVVDFPTDSSIRVRYDTIDDARRFVDEWPFYLNGHPSGNYALHLDAELRLDREKGCQACIHKEDRLRRYAEQIENNKAMRNELVKQLANLPVDVLTEAAELRHRSLSAEDVAALRQIDEG